MKLIIKRAIKTAEEIRKFQKNIKLIKLNSFNEMSWGIWEGLKWSYIKKKYQNLYERREKDKFNFRVPKGESLRILKGRISDVLKKLIKQNKGKTIR